MDHYAVLGLKPGCSEEELKAQYRRLARVYHPDVNPGDVQESTRRLREINAAYEELSDPVKRQRYDTTRTVDIRADRPPPTPYYDAYSPPAEMMTFVGRLRQFRYALLLGFTLLCVLLVLHTSQDRQQQIVLSSPNNEALVSSLTRRAVDLQPQVQSILAQARKVHDYLCGVSRGTGARTPDSPMMWPSPDDPRRRQIIMLGMDIEYLDGLAKGVDDDLTNVAGGNPDMFQPSLDRLETDLNRETDAARTVVRDVRALAPETSGVNH